MQEKVDELYEKYLIEKLDAIFGNNKRVNYEKMINDIPDNNDKENNNYKVVISKHEVLILFNDKIISEEMYDDVGPTINGYIRVSRNKKSNYLDRNGKLISDTWFDNVWPFIDGYARVEKNNLWNFIDTDGNILSDTWFKVLSEFHNDFAIVLQNDKYNFLGKSGNLVSEIWFDDVFYFKDGFAKVKKDNKFNYIDTNGNLISYEWYSTLGEIKNGCILFEKDKKRNFLNTNGSVLSEIWFDDAFDFNDGFAIVQKNFKWNFINTNGKLVSKIWFDNIGIQNFCEGYARVCLNGKWNYIDTNGELISKIWFDDNYDFSSGCAKAKRNGINVKLISEPNFLYIDDMVIPKRIEMDDCQVKKTIFGYECRNETDKYKLKYQPIKKYGFRYTLCLNKNKVYLYDRNDNKYYELGEANDIEFDNNFIKDNVNYKVYLMYENQMINITNYFVTNISGNEDKISINSGIGNILSKGEFALLNSSEIEQIMQEEKEKNQIIKEQQEIKKQRERLEKQNIERQENVQKREETSKEALEKIKDALKTLKENDMNISITREKVENIFVDIGGHKEISDKYSSILPVIDLKFVFFDNVKVNGIDFKETNISFGNFFDPQKVYNKDLSGCDFTGIYIEPMTNFSGVDIRGAKFSVDDKEETYDMFNVTFKNAVYDDKTTYNGIPISKYIEVERQNYDTEIISIDDKNFKKNRV